MPDQTDRLELRGGAVTYDRRLDRVPSQNASRLTAYPVRAVLPSAITPVAKYWRVGPVTDQRAEGACVGHGWTSDAMASPKRIHIGSDQEYAHLHVESNRDVYAYQTYRDAQGIDEWAGDDYEGTSVDAGARVMKQRGIIGEYRWAHNLDDVRDTIIVAGPVILGIVWFDSMYETLASGQVRVFGEIVGGHCLLLYGYNPKTLVNGRYQEIFRLHNSWGLAWGRSGNGWITRDDLQKIWDEHGEGCVPITRYMLPEAA